MFTDDELKHIAYLMRKIISEYPKGHGWRTSAEGILKKINEPADA